MTVRQQWAVVLAVVLVLGGGLFAGTVLLRDELFPLTIGSKAPDFHALTIDGEPRPKTLADYRGSVVLLNIWATWCGPCVVEMPSIQRLHDRFGARGLKIVAVSVDNPGTQDGIRAFRDKYGLTFEILHDPTFRIKRIYQTTGVPETFIIAEDGTIRRKYIGADDWDSEANQALIAALLGAPRPVTGDTLAAGASPSAARPSP